MKYWYLKKYKDLKIKLIPELTRDVNTYFVMPKHYKERYYAIKNSDISTLQEEDLRIMLFSILNHEKIKNNKVILIIDRLLEIPDNFLPITNYCLTEMLDEIKNLTNNKPTEEKLLSNNVAACYNCIQVFYVDKIKYINKKGYCLCPYCKNHTLYFDNDFIPMNESFLRLAKLVLGTTNLGCKFNNLQKLLKSSVKVSKEVPAATNCAMFLKKNKSNVVLKLDFIEFQLEEFNYKKELTSKEEEMIHYTFNECFKILEKNLISKVIIDTSIINSNNYQLYLVLLILILENLGRNIYLKEIILVCKNNKDEKIYSDMIAELIKVKI